MRVQSDYYAFGVPVKVVAPAPAEVRPYQPLRSIAQPELTAARPSAVVRRAAMTFVMGKWSRPRLVARSRSERTIDA